MIKRTRTRIIALMLLVAMAMSASPFVLSFSVIANEATEADDNDNDETDGAIIEADQLHFTRFHYPEQKLRTMEHIQTYNQFELWVHRVTGEVAVRDTYTEQILFSNPYDVALQEGLTPDFRAQLFSQIVVNFNEVRTGNTREFRSFTEAAMRDQISVTEIRNGVRVDYIIGQPDQRRVLPFSMRASTWHERVLADPMVADDLNVRQRIVGAFSRVDPWPDTVSEELRADWFERYPVLTRPGNEGMVIYIASVQLTNPERNRVEAVFRGLGFTLEDVDIEHGYTEFVMPLEINPVFRVSLEYRLDAEGLSVRLPANSISFNEEFFQLNHIDVLPYMGATHNRFDGYSFFPDGSGTLLRAEDTRSISTTVLRGLMYGLDQIYLDVPGTPWGSDNRQHNPRNHVLHMPVFGSVAEVVRYFNPDGTPFVPTPPVDEPPPSTDENDNDDANDNDNDNDEINDNDDVNDNDTPVAPLNIDDNDEDAEGDQDNDDQLVDEDSNGEPEEVELTAVTNRQGFFAIITEGAALAELVTVHGGLTHRYNTTYISVVPRQWDSFDVADAMGVGAQSNWRVVSRRRFTGNYTIRYFMINDHEDNEFEASVSGMADVYRSFLHNNGTLTKIQNPNRDLPLYIETLGTLATRAQFLTFPVWRDTPLTTFEDMMSMTERFATEGISNINFRLYGFANGGLAYSVPNRLSFENSVGGDSGFAEFVDFAAERNIGVFPDFDFVSAQEDARHTTGFLGLGGGFRANRHSAVAINGMRNIILREYSVANQGYIPWFSNGWWLRIIVSPGVYQYFFDQLATHLDNFPTVSISARTFGTWLNSDFNEDRSYNRVDAQQAVERTLQAMSMRGEYSRNVMVDGGNSYVFPYADHILSIPLDSSNLRATHGSVPFMAMVLQGSTSFAGRPMNMAGATQVELLRAIENGSSPHFTLAYQNYHILMTYLPQYFSIGFDIWFDEIVRIYNILNDNLADLQNQFMVRHEFVVAERIPSEQEAQDFAARAELVIGIVREAYQLAQRNYDNAYQLHARLVAEGRIDREDTRNDFYRNIATTGELLEAARATYEETLLAYGTDVEVQYDEDGNFIPTRYTVQDSSIVMTTYENGVRFIINYNQFEVTTVVDGRTHTVPALGFIRINP